MDVFHDDGGFTVVLEHIENAHDVRVRELANLPALFSEHGGSGLVFAYLGQQGLKNDRHIARDVSCEKDLPHAANSDSPQSLVLLRAHHWSTVTDATFQSNGRASASGDSAYVDAD